MIILNEFVCLLSQLNQATHYLDASMIYGSSARQMLALRRKSQGQLLTYTDDHHMQYMPLTNGSSSCQSGATCYKAGDIRANAQPHLTVMHTLWMREHNRIASQLAVLNSHWDDEKLFQETKKIITAFIQHITYNEWLPTLLGKKITKQNGLNLLVKGFSDYYDEDTDPMISNSFATAILPFANSMFNETLRFVYLFLFVSIMTITINIHNLLISPTFYHYRVGINFTDVSSIRSKK